MIDIKQYLEETNTVLITKELFEQLKDRASVLDKIRAEIEQEQDDFMDDKDYDDGVRFGLMLAYQIIDKYKAGGEEK